MKFTPLSRTNIFYHLSENEHKRNLFLQTLQANYQQVYDLLTTTSPHLHKPRVIFDECSILYGVNGKQVTQYFMNIPITMAEQELQLEGTIVDLFHKHHPLFDAFKKIEPKDYFK